MSQTKQAITGKQKNLKIDQEIGKQMEILIPKMQKFAGNYDLADVREKSPFRNVLNVATESGSGVEVTKNYIRYQLGRSGANRMWSNTARRDESFAVALVKEIDTLGKDAEDIIKKVDEDLNKDADKDKNVDKDRIQKVHLRLMQLYLGNLARYQAFLANKRGNN